METLRDARVRRMETYRGLADRAGVSLATVYDVERGNVVPTLTTVRKLARALDVDPATVVELAAALDQHRRPARAAKAGDGEGDADG